MKPKTLILMGVAIVCGLVASYMTSRLISEQQTKTIVLVANKKYNQWTPVQDPAKMFTEKEILENEAPKGYIPKDKIEELRNRTLVKEVPEGGIVQFSDLQDKAKGGMEGLLPHGKRAFAIETSAKFAAGGFVLPGSRVDVIHNMRASTGVGAESRYVLQNVLVRAVDLTNIRPDDRPGMVPTTVTVEVTPEEALKLSQVVTTGSIVLALRPFGDDKKIEEVRNDAPPPPPPPPPEIEAPKKDPKTTEVTQPAKPAELKSRMLCYNGSRWNQRVYVLNERREVVNSEFTDSGSIEPETKPEPKPVKPPDKPESDKKDNN